MASHDLSGESPRQGPEAIFVVGSSRSGTTLMGRILGRHPLVHTFNELHFFEQLCAASELEVPMAPGAAVSLFARLLTIARDGYLGQGDPERFSAEAAKALRETASWPRAGPTPADVFRRFLIHETGRAGRWIPCDQTPRNVFYLDEIRAALPGARVVHMVRDPRDVVYSQKNKWRRRFLGATNIPLREAMRAWINYHPVIVGQLWRGSVRAADRAVGAPWATTVRFEDLLADPEGTLREVCRFLGLDFEASMLEVPRVGSSADVDRPGHTGIDATRTGRWRAGGLSRSEMWLCQKVVGRVAEEHGYALEAVSLPPLRTVLSLAVLPLKLATAAVVNLGRFRPRQLLGAVRRRLSG